MTWVGFYSTIHTSAILEKYHKPRRDDEGVILSLQGGATQAYVIFLRSLRVVVIKQERVVAPRSRSGTTVSSSRLALLFYSVQRERVCSRIEPSALPGALRGVVLPLLWIVVR